MVGSLEPAVALEGQAAHAYELAMEAVRIERDVLHQACGVQDQLHAAFGGWNCFEFHGKRISQRPVLAPQETLERLTDAMFLVFTGQVRSAPEAVAAQLEQTLQGRIGEELAARLRDGGARTSRDRRRRLRRRSRRSAVSSTRAGCSKRSFSPVVSNENINNLYAHGRAGERGVRAASSAGRRSEAFPASFVVKPKDQPRFPLRLRAQQCRAHRLRLARHDDAPPPDGARLRRWHIANLRMVL